MPMQENANGSVRGLKAEIQALTRPGFAVVVCCVLFKVFGAKRVEKAFDHPDKRSSAPLFRKSNP